MSDLYELRAIRNTRWIRLFVSVFIILMIAVSLFWIHTATADDLSNVSDTLSDSAPSANSNHTFEFTTPNGMDDQGRTMTFTFPAGFGLTGVDEDDLDISTGTPITTALDCSGTEQMGVGVSGQVVTLTSCAGDFGEIASSSVVMVFMGNHASTSGSGVDQIDNPSVEGSYTISIGGTMEDSGDAIVAIVEPIIMSGGIDNTFTFTVIAVNSNQTVNADTTTTSATTTSTTLSFGALEAGNEALLAQDLTVGTNAANGFTVTIRTNAAFDSATGADIDTFANGGASSTPVAWESPVAYLDQEATWGHFGITSEDATLPAGDEFSDAFYAGNFLSNDRIIFYHDGPADEATPNIGATRVGFKVETSSLQEAASDYSTTLTYIATPTF